MTEKQINILIWDDDPEEANNIFTWVEHVKSENGWNNIELEVKDGPYKQFENFLIANHKYNHLLIMDCLEPNPDKEKAKIIKNALKKLRYLKSDIRVIAVTVDSEKMGDDFLNLKKIYKNCRFILKRVFLEPDHDEFCENVLSQELGLPLSRNKLTEDIELKIEPDIYLFHLIDTLGGANKLKLMILEGKRSGNIEPINNKFEVEGLSQGLSGAIVLKLQYTGKNNTITTRFVKISGEHGKLKNELEKAKNEYRYFPSTYRLSYENSEPEKFDDKYYILADLFENGISLRSYIQKDNTARRHLSIIKELMLDCFKPLYAIECSLDVKMTKTQRILEIIKGYRLSFLEKSIKDLKILTDDGIDIIDKLSNIINNYNTHSHFYTKTYSNDVWIHGDLHGNNILINQMKVGTNEKNKIVIIDPANMHVSHWSRDICMLIVDIFAYGIDAGQKEFYGITNIDKWKNLGLNMVQNKTINNDGKNQGVIKSLNWLININNLTDIFSPGVYHHWEFQLSLCVEFLRISYKQDQLPPGKRAACLLIGVEAFNIALNTFNSTKFV